MSGNPIKNTGKGLHRLCYHSYQHRYDKRKSRGVSKGLRILLKSFSNSDSIWYNNWYDQNFEINWKNSFNLSWLSKGIVSFSTIAINRRQCITHSKFNCGQNWERKWCADKSQYSNNSRGGKRKLKHCLNFANYRNYLQQFESELVGSSIWS